MSVTCKPWKKLVPIMTCKHYPKKAHTAELGDATPVAAVAISHNSALQIYEDHIL